MFVCLYGASSNQISSEYICLTETLGSMLADAGYSLVYGAGGAGLMGAAARGFKKKNGYVIGVVPRFLQVDGILYPHCDEIIFTETMRQRKQTMKEKADAFIVTPGGIGTFEEFFEIYTLLSSLIINLPFSISASFPNGALITVFTPSTDTVISLPESRLFDERIPCKRARLQHACVGRCSII